MVSLWKPKGKVWYQKNDDSELGDKEFIEKHKLNLSDNQRKKLVRENNKLAKEIGYPRGVKQMKEEGAL